jgi:serine/threonine-protein kinase RsbW
VISLRLPGSLAYRSLAMRVITAACKLVQFADAEADRERDFEHQVVSAFGEAFNNIALHAFGGQAAGALEIEIEIEPDGLVIRMKDYGVGFDPARVRAPNLEELPESGLGIFTIQSFMDEVHYQKGVPNVLTMTKRLALPAVSQNPQRKGKGQSQW